MQRVPAPREGPSRHCARRRRDCLSRYDNRSRAHDEPPRRHDASFVDTPPAARSWSNLQRCPSPPRTTWHLFAARFVKMRHFGLLALGIVNKKLAKARALIEDRRSTSVTRTKASGQHILAAPAADKPRPCPFSRVGLLHRQPLPPNRSATTPLLDSSWAQPPLDLRQIEASEGASHGPIRPRAAPHLASKAVPRQSQGPTPGIGACSVPVVAAVPAAPYI